MNSASASYSPPSGLDNYVQPTLGHGLRIWWAFYWRQTVLLLILMIGAGVLMAALGASGQMRAYLLAQGPLVFGLLAAIFVLRYVLNRRFKTFRIGLTAVGGEDDGKPETLTTKRTLRIWWTYAWRTTVYTLVLLFVMSVPAGFVTGAVTMISPQLGAIFSQLVGTAVAAAVGLFVIYSNVLDEEFGSFRVVLLPREQKQASTRAPEIASVNPDASPEASS